MSWKLVLEWYMFPFSVFLLGIVSVYPEDAPPELREALMTKNDIASGSGANSCSSVMVDEPPTGVEDIISPEMMDIEDGDSPGPIHHNETW